jgi:hypothetical protein
MQKTSKNIEQIAIELDNLINDYLQTNQIESGSVYVSIHKTPVNLFKDNTECIFRVDSTNMPYIVYSKRILKNEFTFFSTNI